jgi:hypothetical protein
VPSIAPPRDCAQRHRVEKEGKALEVTLTSRRSMSPPNA